MICDYEAENMNDLEGHLWAEHEDVEVVDHERRPLEGKDNKFPLAPMWVLAPGSAHARPSARAPIDTSGNFPAPVSAEWPSAFKTVKIGFSPIFRSK